MSYNATNWATYGNGNDNIDTNSFFSFKKYNDLFANNYTNLTFHDIYRYYLVIMWFGVTCGLSAYTLKQFYLLCVMVWNRDEGESEDAAVEVPEIAFENRYFTEYDELEEKDLTDKFVKDLALNVIREETPKGEVLMYYSHEMGSFIYYSKTKEIPYKYLETLARKYVIIYDCKRIYIDIRKEYEKGLNNYNEMKENKTPVGGSEVGAAKGDEGGAKRPGGKLGNDTLFSNIKNGLGDPVVILKTPSASYAVGGRTRMFAALAAKTDIKAIILTPEILRQFK